MIRRRTISTYPLDHLIRLPFIVELMIAAAILVPECALAIVANPPAGPTYTETT